MLVYQERVTVHAVALFSLHSQLLQLHLPTRVAVRPLPKISDFGDPILRRILSYNTHKKKRHSVWNAILFLELITGFEPVTSSLPTMFLSFRRVCEGNYPPLSCVILSIYFAQLCVIFAISSNLMCKQTSRKHQGNSK